MAGNVHNHSGGVTGWFKSVASTLSGAFKKGGFLHFKSITKTQPRDSWRIPAGDRENAPGKKPVRMRKTTHARQGQVSSIRPPDTQKKTTVSTPTSQEPSAFQKVRDKQLALVQERQNERHDAVVAFKQACDRKGIGYKQAMEQDVFPKLKAAWNSAKNKVRIAQIGLEKLDQMAGKQ